MARFSLFNKSGLLPGTLPKDVLTRSAVNRRRKVHGLITHAKAGGGGGGCNSGPRPPEPTDDNDPMPPNSQGKSLQNHTYAVIHVVLLFTLLTFCDIIFDFYRAVFASFLVLSEVLSMIICVGCLICSWGVPKEQSFEEQFVRVKLLLGKPTLKHVVNVLGPMLGVTLGLTLGFGIGAGLCGISQGPHCRGPPFTLVFERAISTAERAASTAKRAVSTCDRAVNTGDRAVSSADRAVSLADCAVSTCDRGVSTGDRGVNFADRGVSTAKPMSARKREGRATFGLTLLAYAVGVIAAEGRDGKPSSASSNAYGLAGASLVIMLSALRCKDV